MIEFGGSYYYIDFDALDKVVCSDKAWKAGKVTDVEIRTVSDEKGKKTGEERVEKTYYKGKEIDGAKYDLIRLFIEVLIDYDDDVDDTLGTDRALGKTPLSYKIAFNTLLKEGILKEKE
jgi:hypothetical protein